MMPSNRFYSVCTIAWFSLLDVEGWTQHNHNGIDRRGAIGTIASVVSGSLVFGPGLANANEAATGIDATFDAYNIIPDASASLDPRLEKVDVSGCRLESDQIPMI
jgi:hypothetical protein